MITKEEYMKLLNHKTAEEKKKEIKQRKERIKKTVKALNLPRDEELLILIIRYKKELNIIIKNGESDFNVFTAAIRQANRELTNMAVAEIEETLQKQLM